MCADINIGGFGAISIDSKANFYLVQWTSQPFPLQEDNEVYGIKDAKEAGTMVCKGRFLDNIPRTPGWYVKKGAGNRKHLFWMQHVIGGDITMVPCEKGRHEPRAKGWHKCFKNKRIPYNDIMELPNGEKETILIEKTARSALELLDTIIVEDDGEAMDDEKEVEGDIESEEEEQEEESESEEEEMEEDSD